MPCQQGLRPLFLAYERMAGPVMDRGQDVSRKKKNCARTHAQEVVVGNEGRGPCSHVRTWPPRGRGRDTTWKSKGLCRRRIKKDSWQDGCTV